MIIENLAITREEKLKLLKRTFDKYDISSEDFTRTRKHYEKDADFWIRVYYRVQQRIKDKSTL